MRNKTSNTENKKRSGDRTFLIIPFLGVGAWLALFGFCSFCNLVDVSWRV